MHKIYTNPGLDPPVRVPAPNAGEQGDQMFQVYDTPFFRGRKNTEAQFIGSQPSGDYPTIIPLIMIGGW